MRASEEHNKHNDETHRLLGLLEQKDRELATMIAAEPGGTASTRNREIVAAVEALGALRMALKEHANGPAHFVRNYRILDSQSGAAVDEFTDDYEVAPWTASKRMAEKQIRTYDLQEQQHDGSWLSYFPEGS